MRTCTKCGVEKPLSEFYARKNGNHRRDCKACVRARARAYGERNKAKVNAAARRYYWEHRTERLAKVKAQYDPEAKRAYDIAYRARTMEQQREWRRQWQARNPEKYRATYLKRNHERRGATRVDATSKAYMVVLRGDPCCYCGGAMEHVDHIEPISVGGSGGWSNLTAACQACNYSKGTNPLLAWLGGRW